MSQYLDAWRAFQTSDGDLYGQLSPEQLQAVIDAGLVVPQTHSYSNESGAGTTTSYNVDWSKMPAIGPPGLGNKQGNWMPADPSRLINPKLVYNDPNYGLITPTYNDKANQDTGWGKYVGPAVMGVAALAGAPWYLTAGLQAAKTIGAAMDLPHWTDIFSGGAKAASQPAPAAPTPAAAALPPGGLPSTYNPGMYGNMGSMAAPPSGAAPVMSALVPNAYDNSSPNSVVS